MREFCREKGILVTAYSPLGAKGTIWGTNKVMECDVLKEIAVSKGKTIAQVLTILFMKNNYFMFFFGLFALAAPQLIALLRCGP